MHRRTARAPLLVRVFLGVIVLCAAAAPVARAQDATPTPAMGRAERVRLLARRTWRVRAARVSGDLRIDGLTTDGAWDLAEPIADFYQRERHEGLPATERTEVRVLYDDEHLYVAFRCYDRTPDLVRARAMFRDESAAADDLVSVLIDAFHDHRSAIQFVSNANGLMEDLLQTGENESTRNHDFDAVWHARGSRTPYGYDVEITIPFKSLRFEAPPDGEPLTFGIGFKRNIPRKNEEVYWPFVPNDSTWYRPAELGHVEGIAGVTPGRNVQVRPYVLAGASRDFSARATDGRREAGVDAKWGVTTGLTADFTVNTDFAQEEVDSQQINFTRFSLFFPEKRQLFLENEQMFRFGVPQEADLVFTRRIGLSGTGRLVPLLAGARLAGRQGRTTVGLMNMQTGDVDSLGVPSENFTVLRVRRDLMSRSSVGLLFTNRQGGGGANRVLGADARFFFRRVWFFEGFVAGVDDDAHPEAATAAYGRFAYDTDRYGASWRYLDVGEGFSPGVGYVRRRDMRQNAWQARWSPRPQSDLVRQFDLTAGLSYLTDRRNVLETREQTAGFRTGFETGDAVTIEGTSRLESIEDPFLLRPDVVVQPGTYRFSSVDVKVETFRRRHARLTAVVSTGGFWNGTRTMASARSDWRLTPHVGVGLNWDTNWVRLPAGRFTTHLVSSRLQLAFRNDAALQGLFQYNTSTRQLSTNIRFNWIPKPGSDVFVVYNELDESRGGLAVRNRSLVVKINFLFAM